MLIVLPGRCATPIPRPLAGAATTLTGGVAGRPGGVVLLDVLPGEVDTTALSAALARPGRPPRWVRPAPYDEDPAALDALASAIRTRAGPEGPVVVESTDRRLAERFLDRLSAAGPDTAGVPDGVLLCHRTGIGDGGRTPPPDAACPGRLAALTWSRPALRASIEAAGRRLPAGELAALLARSRGLEDLTTRLAARLLRAAPADTRAAHDLALRLGYCHAGLHPLASLAGGCGDLPWWIPLAGRWWYLDPAWGTALHTACRGEARRRMHLLGPLVNDLVGRGATDSAIELCLDAGYPGTASDLLAAYGPDLLAAGRPLALERWLRRLPAGVRRRHRGLTRQVRAALPARTGREGVPGPLPPGSGRNGVPGPARPGIGARTRAGPASGATSGRGRAAATVAAGPEPPPAPDTALADWPGTAGAPPEDTAGPSTLRARLLGAFDIDIGGRGVCHWHGRKGPLLLAYLMLNRARPVSRDALAAAFWPDASPAAARNRMHVALHALRTDLLAASPVPVVVFDGSYRINPDLDVRIDTEAFERAAACGRHAEAHGRPREALAAYRDAGRAYRGDLLADHPYDGWALLPRERYRLLMLDVLARAAGLAFDAGRYDEAVAAGHRLLALDLCREDLHRLMMRAYSRLGWPHLALYQYELCAQHLRRELDIPPAPETVDLYGRIRTRTPV